MRANKALLLIFIAGIALRSLLWCFQQDAAGDDGQRYLSESKNLVAHGVFSTEKYDWDTALTSRSEPPPPSAHDLPLWPGIMAFVLWVTGSETLTIRIMGLANIILSSGAGLLLDSMLAKKPFSFSAVGRCFSLSIFLFMPETIPYSLFYMPDTIAVFFCVLALWLYFKGIYDKNGYVFLSFMVFGLAILAKPICLPLALAFAVVLLFLLRAKFPRRVFCMLSGIFIITLMLAPWMYRNKRAFCTAGLSSIAGTNLYGCNWHWMVKSWPEARREKTLADDERFERSVQSYDLMERSRRYGAYAKARIAEHLPQYVLFTIKRHPRLYAGTGCISLFRYLGLGGACTVLEKYSGVGQFVQEPTRADRIAAHAILVLEYLLLFGGYAAIGWGFLRGCKLSIASFRETKSLFSPVGVVFLCAVLSMLLFALVIGPITSTRYRYIMIPYFSILAGFLGGAGENKIGEPNVSGTPAPEGG